MFYNALITGIAGQTGSHLADYILENHPECRVHGIVRYRSDLSSIDHITNKIVLHDCDLRDAHNTYKVVKDCLPDVVFHLAATSFVKTSFYCPAEVLHNNTISQINLMEAVIKANRSAMFQIAGSSEEYGLVHPDETPIKETNPLRPISPYAISKVTQENLGYQYHKSYGLKAILTRTFNHTGPRRPEVFVESSFCKQVAMIEAGLQEPTIYHGDLSSVRDYTDARDIARAYWLAAENCDVAEPYNICSNTKFTIGAILDKILSMSEVKVEKKLDESRLRPSDVTLLHGCADKFMTQTGWSPTYGLGQTLEDLLNAWREKLRK